MIDSNTWLITLTNRRVIFLDKGMIYGLKHIDVNLKDIVSVGGKTGLIFGDILISTSGQNYSIKQVSKSSVVPFINLINETRDNPHSSIPTNAQPHSSTSEKPFDDAISKLERLAELKENGVLTDEEFQQQKQRVLNG